MEFNLHKFLVEHKLTTRSRLNEDDNTGGMMKTEAEQGEMDDEGMFGNEPEDTYYKDEFDDTGDSEKEPAAKDIEKNDFTAPDMQKQDLQSLIKKLATLWNSEEITTDEYKSLVGLTNGKAATNKELNDFLTSYKEGMQGKKEEDFLSNYKAFLGQHELKFSIPATIKKLISATTLSATDDEEEEGI